MARRKQSGFEDLIDFASLLPWWVCLICALVLYVVLHQVAVIENIQFNGTSELGKAIYLQFFKSIAHVGQFVFPLAFVIGALVSWFKRWRSANLFKQQKSIPTIRNLSWQDFEELITEAFRRRGYRVNKTKEGADGGVDIVIAKDGRTKLVQCKHWKANQVGVKEVRELKGIVAMKGVYSGILVTSGAFTTQAMEEAKIAGIELIDNQQLVSLLPQINVNEVRPVTQQNNLIPQCPRCGNGMVKRTAKKGLNVGKEFWGCSGFPGCRGVSNMS